VPIKSNTDRLYIIDLLRFAAAFAVVLYHFTFHQWALEHSSPAKFLELSDVVSYGCLAVPLFFMISGFVITRSMQGKTALQFAWGRFVRLYPTFWICLLITFIGMHFAGPAIGWDGRSFDPMNWWQDSHQFRTLMANFTMMPRHLHEPFIDSPYWSLQVELRFYALMFILLLFKRGHALIPFATVWLAVSIIDWFHPIPYVHVYCALENAPFFVAGMVFSAIYERGWKWTDLSLLIVSYVVGCYRSVIDLHQDITEKGVEANASVICFVLAACFLLFAAIALRKLTIQTPRAWITALGGITYPLYLLHNNLGMTLFANFPGVNRWLMLTSLLLGFSALAYCIWRFCELPIQRYLKRCFRRTNPHPPHLSAPENAAASHS
jgi:peptidoglycan/LPS O-acetylase OafA/YrhL